MFSVFAKWWTFVELCNLATLNPAILDQIGKWEKADPPSKQAMVFKPHQKTAIYSLSLTDWAVLPYLAYMVVARAFAARGAEAYELKWKDVVRQEEPDG